MIFDNELLEACDNLFDSELGKKIYTNIIKTVNDFGMQKMLSAGTVVGLSGGADSVLLLIFLRKLRKEHNFNLKAVHINHMIRAADADRDEVFSRNLSKLLDVEFSSYSYDVPRLASERKSGIEETARSVRYEAFEKSLGNGYSTVATAHNATDNTETFIFNFIRGAGTLGLTAISPVRDNIVRPLITISKEDILALLAENHIPFCTDETNFSCEYTRNYIRHEILPKLKHLSQNPDESSARTIANVRCDSDFIEEYSKLFFKKNYTDGAISASSLRELHKAPLVRVIKRMAKEVTDSVPEKIHFDEIFKLLKTQKNFEIDLPGGIAFYLKDGICHIAEKSYPKDKKEIFVKLKESFNEIPELDIAVGISNGKCEDFSSNVYKFSIQANLLSAIIDGELYLRTRKDGDSYFYGGINRKLKKLFNDKKIPIDKRDLIPVICDSNGILWVPGFGVRDDNPSEKNSVWITVYEKTK